MERQEASAAVLAGRGQAVLCGEKTLLSDSQRPRSKLTGHQSCNAAQLRGL